MVRQWGGNSISKGQSIALIVDNKQQRASVAEEIKAEAGNVSVFELGSELNVSKVDGVIAFGATHVDNTLKQALAALKPGGFIALYVPSSASQQSEVEEKLMFSGFVNNKTTPGKEFTEFSASKPDWEVGASQKLNLKKPSNNLSAQDANNIWSASANNNEDLIDEDSLLDESDRNSKPVTSDDCDVGKQGKKACKNCTCGRAEEENGGAPVKAKLTKEMVENPGVGSNCGSCGLGDAFRCAGCPYRGLPSFKVGEKITIPDNFMSDDI